MDTRPTYKLYDWIGKHARLVTALTLVLVIGLAIGGSLVVNEDEPSFDPAGEVFDVAERADATLRSESAIASAGFLVEAPEGNALAPAAIREWHAASELVRAAHADHLVAGFDSDAGVATSGVFAITDVVDASLPDGIEGATDSELSAAVTETLSADSPFADLRFSLAESATTTTTADGRVVWTAPAFIAEVTYDTDTFPSYAAQELWLRDVQADMRADAIHTAPIGIAIDGDTTFEEAAEGSAPFIFLAVALIVGLIAIVHRSYWSAVVAAAGLAATSLAYYGTSAFLGLEMGSLLLAFIVPIAMIGFGVDFFVHGVGRVREMQMEGMAPEQAYPSGMLAVIKALSLAAVTSIAAFLVNAVSGTEAIVEFGIGAAISLAWAYLILGQLAPRVVVGLEQFVGRNPVKRFARVPYAALMVVVAVLGGLTVALTAVMPLMGAGAFGGFVALAIAAPSLAARRRNRKARTSGKSLDTALRGAAHGLASVGWLTWFVARWRKVTLPLVTAAGIAALIVALGVESGFSINDFLAEDTDFVQSIEKTGEHFPSNGEGSSFIFVEGDLTDPAALQALDTAIAGLDASDAQFGRTPTGELIVGSHAGDLVRMTMASPHAVDAITTSGTSLADADLDGFPDTAAGVRAIYDYVAANGVLTPEGDVVIAPADVPGILADDGAVVQATAVSIQVGSFTDGTIIQPVRDELEEQASGIDAAVAGVDAAVSGEVITQFESLNSFTSSMLTSLPLALLITLVLAALILRSVRFALVSIIPIGFVVAGIYAFMAVAGYTVNVVTATIAAIAVGVGIDFSTHFTARFREELQRSGDPLTAVRTAGAGTGGALVLSAITSVLGFAVMATAPTPIFATFGLLTAVMIGLALAASLLVLPGLLVMAAPKVEPIAADAQPQRVLVNA